MNTDNKDEIIKKLELELEHQKVQIENQRDTIIKLREKNDMLIAMVEGVIKNV